MKRTESAKRTYKAHGRREVAQAIRLNDCHIHVFVEQERQPPFYRLDIREFTVFGDFADVVKELQGDYGCAWERCRHNMFFNDMLSPNAGI